MMFGDNETVVNTSSIPHARLHKRHAMLSMHRLREAISSAMVRFHHIPGADNPADILSKHWDSPSVWECLQPMLFWQGDTAKLIKPQVADSDKLEQS